MGIYLLFTLLAAVIFESLLYLFAPADLPGANDANRLAHHVEPDQPVQREIMFTNAVIGAIDLAVEGQQQRHGVLGHRMRRIRGHSYDRQLEFPCFGHIHIVEPGTSKCHEFHTHFSQYVQNRGIRAVIPDENAATTLGSPIALDTNGVRVQVAAEDVELARELLDKEDPSE